MNDANLNTKLVVNDKMKEDEESVAGPGRDGWNGRKKRRAITCWTHTTREETE